MFCVYVYIYITVQGQAVSRIYVHIHTMGCQMLALGLTSLHALFRGQVGNLIARPILALFLLGLTLPHLIGKEAYLVDWCHPITRVLKGKAINTKQNASDSQKKTWPAPNRICFFYWVRGSPFGRLNVEYLAWCFTRAIVTSYTSIQTTNPDPLKTSPQATKILFQPPQNKPRRPNTSPDIHNTNPDA